MKSNTRGFRYLVLFVTCMFVFGSYYSYDMPSVVMSQLEGKDVPEDGAEPNIYSLSQEEYGMLYSIYSIFNFISVCFGGYFIDRFGFNVCAMVFSGFLCLGQATFALGVTINEYWVMVLGRAIFGLGGGNIGTCQNCVCSNYFKGKELSMSFSICLAVSRLGSVLNFFTTSYLIDPMKDNRNLPAIFWMGFGLCVASLAFIITFFFLDRKFIDDQLKEWEFSAKRLFPGRKITVKAEKGKQVEFILEDKAEDNKLDDSDSNNNSDKSINDSDSAERFENDEEKLQYLEKLYPLRKTNKSIKLKAVKTFGVTYWFLDVLCGLFYPCLFVFIAICNDFIAVKYPGEYDDHERSIITGIVYDVSLVISPWFGIIVDKYGGRLWIQLAATVLLFPSFLLFLLTNIDPWWPVVILGVSYSIMAAALWSAVPLIVPLNSVGTALSFMTAVQMLFNTIIQMIISAISPNIEDELVSPESYDSVIYTFIGIACATIVDIAIIYFLDRQRGGWINKNDTTGKYNADGTLRNAGNKNGKGEKEVLVKEHDVESSGSGSVSSTSSN